MRMTILALWIFCNGDTVDGITFATTYSMPRTTGWRNHDHVL